MTQIFSFILFQKELIVSKVILLLGAKVRVRYLFAIFWKIYEKHLADNIAEMSEV